jgi:phosphoribosylamine--glycine ligase
MAALERFGAPVVVKASGLAAGKGVIVAHTREEAESAIEAMFAGRAFGAAGDTVLVEEFMEGEELSLFVVTDGERVVPLIAAQDHKRLLDGDRGPNTGGMGAYAPVAIADAPLIGRIIETIVLPTLAAMRDAGRPFTGLLYAGVMLTGEGPRVVEFNCRFGDPETQAVLPILSAAPSLLELMRRVAHGDPLPENAVVAATGAAVTIVIAAAGYPDAPRSGMEIVIPPVEEGVIVFHAGTAHGGHGRVVVSGGRVVAVTAVADTIANAAAASRGFAERVEFEGRQLRRDIAWRELARTSTP